MDKDVRGCQKESYNKCSTRRYLKALMNKCQCLQFQMIQSEKVGNTGCSKNITALACYYSGATALFLLGHSVCYLEKIYISIDI